MEFLTGTGRVRYYLGVDWADQTHAVWVVGADGAKITGRTVPHTAEGFSEWGRELHEWRAQGIALWAAIERREGRVGRRRGLLTLRLGRPFDYECLPMLQQWRLRTN
jgi:hypothetical protein